MDLVRLCDGTFDMGCTAAQQADGYCYADELPAHSVTLSNDFWMAETEVTQGQWQALLGNNPSSECGLDCPVGNVNWWESLAFANAVSTAEGLSECFNLSGCTGTTGVDLLCTDVAINSASGSIYDCEGYRLPTEAEWEYAARAGTDYLYAGSDAIDEVAWWYGNWPVPSSDVNPVATRAANDWDLYDLTGNAWEWYWDRYESTYYSSSPSTNPEGPSSGSWRGVRGGGGPAVSIDCRVSSRSFYLQAEHADNEFGFRLARTVP